MASQTITHVIELIARPGEVIVSTPIEGLEQARESLAATFAYEAEHATTPEEKAMFTLALTKAATLRPGSTISIGNGTAYALTKVT